MGPLLAKLTRYRQSYRARLDSNFVCIQNIHIFAVALESFIALVTTLFHGLMLAAFSLDTVLAWFSRHPWFLLLLFYILWMEAVLD